MRMLASIGSRGAACPLLAFYTAGRRISKGIGDGATARQLRPPRVDQLQTLLVSLQRCWRVEAIVVPNRSPGRQVVAQCSGQPAAAAP